MSTDCLESFEKALPAWVAGASVKKDVVRVLEVIRGTLEAQALILTYDVRYEPRKAAEAHRAKEDEGS